MLIVKSRARGNGRAPPRFLGLWHELTDPWPDLLVYGRAIVHPCLRFLYPWPGALDNWP